MKTLLLALVLTAPHALFAGINASSIAVAGEISRPAPAATVVQKADFLCAVILIRSSNREVERQTAAVQQSVQALRTAAERSTRFQIHDGPVQSTSPLPQSGVSAGVLQASVRILAPLAGSNATDIIGHIRSIRQFIAGIDTTGGAALEVASIGLAVEAPEQYRERLLEAIAEQTRVAHRSLDARSTTVEGLGNGIGVRQLDEINVELFIEHQISATIVR